MGNYKYSFDRNFIIFWQLELVYYLFCFWQLYPVYCKFWLRDEKCQCYLIYDKANGDVARLEWVGDAFNDDANFRKSVKLKQK